MPAGDGTSLAYQPTALAAGRFNGDCYADLAIGLGQEKVVVLYGSAQGLRTTGAHRFDQRDVAPTPGAAASFGNELRSGDINGDGRDDLVAGMYDASGGGAIAVLYGHSSGLRTAGKQLITAHSVGVLALNGDPKLGGSVAVADINRDGRDDVIAGASNADIGVPGGGDSAGVVVVWKGSTTGLLTTGEQIWSEGSPGVPGTIDGSDYWGETVAAGDLNRDGYADVAVASTFEGDDLSGTVTVLYGSPELLTATGSKRFTQNSAGIPGSADRNDYFGQELAIGDLNRDGAADLAIAAPAEAINNAYQAGTVTIVWGRTSGVSGEGATLVTENTSGVPGSVAPDRNFGSTLGFLPPSNPQGYGTLLVSSSTGLWRSGFVALPGAASGFPAASGAKEWRRADFSPALDTGFHIS